MFSNSLCRVALLPGLLLGLFATATVVGQTGLPNLEEALELSRKSGVPILAMAGRKT